jgi:molecular chaperone HscA
MTISVSDAELFLTTLIRRAELSAGSIERLSAYEVTALRIALEAIKSKGEVTSPSGLEQSEPYGIPMVGESSGALIGESPETRVRDTIQLSLAAFEVTECQNQVTVCIDFGTAASKAFAMAGWNEPIDLPLGRIAGSQSPYPVESSVFINDQKMIIFGPKAVEASDRVVETGRRRFDSIKSRFNAGSEVDINRVPISAAINPFLDEYPLTEGDIVALYLAYLGWIVGLALEEKGYSRYTQRRYARPCWSPERRQWADPLMRDLITKGQILADTFGDRLRNGIPLKDAWDALKKVNDLNPTEILGLRNRLLADDLAEPVAAAAPYAVMQDKGWQFVLVVDVGAGTTDLGLFLIQARPNSDHSAIRVIPGSITYVSAAGDMVDNILRSFVLKSEGVDLHTAAGGQAAALLTNYIRRHKETLYRDGIVEIPVGDGRECVVDREAFLRSALVGEFRKKINDVVQAVFNNVDGGYIRRASELGGVKVMLTGGGGSLPMVKDAVRGPFVAHGINIYTQILSPLPEWAEDNMELSTVYPQLAVAAGGASPELPIEAKEFERPGFA